MNSASQWALQQQAIRRASVHKLVEQQALFRLFQSLEAGDFEKAEKVVEKGLSVDTMMFSPRRQETPGSERIFARLESALGFPSKADPETDLSPEAKKIIYGEGFLSKINALGYFACLDNLENLKWLIGRGALPRFPLDRGSDAAWLAMVSGAWGSYQYLMDSGASPNTRLSDGTGVTRLMLAARLRDIPAVKDLVNRKAELDLFDARGQTALHHSLRQMPYKESDEEITRILVFAGASRVFEDNEGVRPENLMTSPKSEAMLRNVEGLEKKPEQKPEPKARPRPRPKPPRV